MYERIQNIKRGLVARRDTLFEKSEQLGAQILELNRQIEDLDLLTRSFGVKEENLMAQIKAPIPIPVQQDYRVKTGKLTIREIIELWRGYEDGFTPREVVQRARQLPSPQDLNLDSVRSIMTKMKAERILTILIENPGTGESVYGFR